MINQKNPESVSSLKSGHVGASVGSVLQRCGVSIGSVLQSVRCFNRFSDSIGLVLQQVRCFNRGFRSEPKLEKFKFFSKNRLSIKKKFRNFFCARSIQNGLKRVLSKKNFFFKFFFQNFMFRSRSYLSSFGQNDPFLVKNGIYFSIPSKYSPTRFFWYTCSLDAPNVHALAHQRTPFFPLGGHFWAFWAPK